MPTFDIRRVAVLASAVGACALAAAGCGSDDESAASGGGSEDAMTVGVTVQNYTNPFFVAEARTVESEGKKRGLEVLSANGNQDVPTQSNQVDQFVREKVDFIVIDAIDTEGLGPAVLRAKQADIPVVAIDVDATGADATVTTDNVQAGRISCEALAEQLGGEGNVAILDGTPISAVAERVEGCKAALSEQPGIEIVAAQRGDNGRDKALTVANDMLTANPDIDGFFAINDPTATGVELAAKQKNKQLVITSVDGAEVAVKSITSEDGLITATAAQDPVELARTGLELGIQLAKGETPAETDLKLPTELIDAKAAKSYEPWG